MKIPAEQIFLYYTIQYAARNCLLQFATKPATKQKKNEEENKNNSTRESFVSFLYQDLFSDQLHLSAHNSTRKIYSSIPDIRKRLKLPHLDSKLILENEINETNQYDIHQLNKSLISDYFKILEKGKNTISFNIDTRLNPKFISFAVENIICNDIGTEDKIHTQDILLRFIKHHKLCLKFNAYETRIARAIGLRIFDYIVENHGSTIKEATQSTSEYVQSILNQMPLEKMTAPITYFDEETKINTIYRNTYESIRIREPVAITSS